MNNRWILIALMAFGLIGLGAAIARAEEKKGAKDEENEVKIPLEQAPAAVRETLKKEAPTGELEDIAKKTQDGKTVYEVDVKVDGKKREILIAEDGTLIHNILDDEQDDKNPSKDEDKKPEKI